MSAVRRWYIYLVCAISLHAIIWAVIFLLRTLLLPGMQLSFNAIAFQIAVIVVGMPIFLAHWLQAQRSLSNPEERGNYVRRLYLYGMLAGFLGPFLANAFNLVSLIFMALFGSALPTTPLFGERPLDASASSTSGLLRSLTAMVVLALIYTYNYRIAAKDARVVPERGSSAVIRRLFVLGFSAAGLFLTSLAVINMLRWLMFQFSASAFSGASSGDAIISKEIARLVVGLPLWLIFWGWAGRLFGGPSVDERESVLRYFYLYSTIFIAAISSVTNATFVLAAYLRRLLGLLPDAGHSFGGDVRGPIAIIFVTALVWAYHAQVLRRDSSRFEEAARQAGIRRIYLYLIAAVGLSAALVGLSGNISVLIRLLAQNSFDPALKLQLAWFTAALIAGVPVWLLAWRTVQVDAEAQSVEGSEERLSLVRKIYLYFFLFLATMTVLSGAVYVVYQLLKLLLGERSQAYLIRDIGQAISFALIGVGVWLYHGAVLRRDGQTSGQERSTRLAEWQALVFDLGDGSFGNSLLEEIKRTMPGITLSLVRLPLQAEAEIRTAASLPEQIAVSDLIVGPWTIAVSGGSGGKVSAEIATAVLNSPARKILIPSKEEGWDWAGVASYKSETLVQQSLHAVRQVIEGEEVKAQKPLSFGASVVIFLGGLFVLIMLMSLLGNLYDTLF